jgi:hypothetical protein
MLGRVPRTEVTLGTRNVPAFAACGWLAFVLAIVLVVALAAARGLSVATQLGVAAAAAAAYFTVARLARQLAGRAVLIYYHHIIVFLGAAAVLLAALRAPIRVHLDVTVCGLALFTAVARLGCLMVGCCHGQPASRGIAYGPAHRRYGTPRYLTGVPLIPVQGVEAAACLLLAVAATVTVLAHAPAGTALVIFLDGYALLRFGLEWLRGDLHRRYVGSLSEAQWTSLAITFVVGALALAGTLPGGPPLLAPAVALVAAAVGSARGRVPRPAELLAPVHVAELADTLSRLPVSPPSRVVTAVTSRGLRVSIGETGGRAHYTLTAQTPLDEESGRRLGRAVLWLVRDDSAPELSHGPGGTLHVISARPVSG